MPLPDSAVTSAASLVPAIGGGGDVGVVCGCAWLVREVSPCPCHVICPTLLVLERLLVDELSSAKRERGYGRGSERGKGRGRERGKGRGRERANGRGRERGKGRERDKREREEGRERTGEKERDAKSVRAGIILVDDEGTKHVRTSRNSTPYIVSDRERPGGYKTGWDETSHHCGQLRDRLLTSYICLSLRLFLFL
jgi:hypothetical protein